jgi:hypothetical protein
MSFCLSIVTIQYLSRNASIDRYSSIAHANSLSSNSGRHCEHLANSIVIRQYVSKIVPYIATIIILITVGYIIIFDILTYTFGIDLTAKKSLKNISSTTYINKVALLAPPQKPKEQPKF